MSDKKKVEAVLFASGKYMTAEEIAAYTKISVKKVKKAVEELKNYYEKEDTCLKVFSEEDSWKINVKEDYSDFVREVVADAEIPRSIMETLALIAYKTPVLQSDIIKNRGQHAYDHIAYLEKKKLIYKEPSGRSYKLKLTDKFHEYFDVEEPEMQNLFKNVKQPDPEKIGSLEVYESKNEDFEANLDNLKRPEEKQSEEDTEEYLSDFDKKLESVKSRIEESDEVLKESEIDKSEQSESEDLEGSEQEDQETEELEDSGEEKDEQSTSVESDKETLEEETEKKDDESNVLKKVNQDIQELTGEDK